jgi:hypothetical protein
MAQTNLVLPTTVIPNTTAGTDWLTPNNILLADSAYAISAGSSQIITVGNFPLNLVQGDSVTNIVVAVKGYRGTFNTTLQIFAIDNTSGVELSYPLLPTFQGFDGTNTLYTMPASLFGTTWTVDQVNNIKIRMIADGELYLDFVQVNVIYTPVSVLPDPVPGDTGETVCDEFVQAIGFQLAQSMTSSDLFCFLQSFNYSDGTNIEFADFHGEEALLVIDQGVANKMENVRITAVDQNYQGSGLCRLSFSTLDNRGLAFKYPYTTDADLRQDHSASAEVIISNSAPFYARFLKRCNIDALVSAPIEVDYEDVTVTTSLHRANFKGGGVVVTPAASDVEHDVDITIAGAGTSSPVPDDTSSATSGSTQVPSLTWEHTCSGVDRLLTVQVSMEAGLTISSLTYNGDALAQAVAQEGASDTRTEIWYLEAPDLGTHDIVVTFSADSYCSAGAESWVNVDQTTPIGDVVSATGADLNPTVDLTTIYDNSIIVDALSTAATPIVYTAGAGQNENWSYTSNTDTRQGASSYEPAGSAPDVVTMDWTITQNTEWSIAAIEIKGITTAVSTLTVEEQDGTPSVVNVTKIKVTNGTLTDDGGGVVSINTGGGGPGTLEVQSDGVTVETGVDTINFTNGTVTSPSAGVVDVDLSGTGGGGTGGGIIYPTEQILGTRDLNDGGNVVFTMDGTEIYVSTNDPSNGLDVEVTRYTADGATGMFYQTHGSDSITNAADGDISLTVVGDYVYAIYDNGSDVDVRRLDKADLTNNTVMTIPAVIDSVAGSFSDGTDLYIGSSATPGDFRRYTISGTTLTLASTITGGLASCTGAWYEDGNVYMTAANGTTNTYTISGTTFVLVTTVTRNFAGYTGDTEKLLNKGGSLMNAVGRDAQTLYYGYVTYITEGESPSTNDYVGLMLKAFGRTDASLPSGSSGSIISLEALEDFAAGDPVTFASFLEDTAAKAAWEVRNANTSYIDKTSGVYSCISIDTDKYVLALQTYPVGNSQHAAVVATLDRDTLTWSFGTVRLIGAAFYAAPTLVKLNTDKFAYLLFNDTVNYDMEVVVCTVSGTTITVGGSDNVTSGDNAAYISAVQLATDRFAMILSTSGTGGVADLYEVSVSGTTPTIGTLQNITGSNTIALIEKIATDKIAILYEGFVKICTVSGGVWTLGTSLATPVTFSDSAQRLGLISITDNEFYVAGANSGTGLVYAYKYTVSGTTPTLAASGSFTGAGLDTIVLLTDNTDIFLFTQLTAQKGVQKLTVDGATIEFSRIITVDLSQDLTSTISILQNTVIKGADYYGIWQYDGTGTLDQINYNYHIQGMNDYFIGFVQAVTSRGAQVSILISGVDTHQSGLTQGTIYVPSAGELIAGDTTDPFFVQAQNATSVKI